MYLKQNRLIKKNPLTKLENVVLVPHIGSSTRETRDKNGKSYCRKSQSRH